MRMRGRVRGPVVHVPLRLGGSTEGALPSRHPARHWDGTGCAAGGGEGMAHRGSSDGVSCASGGGLQASIN